MPPLENLLLVIVVSYLIGSFPTAYLAGRLNKINIFEAGSGNMGAANTFRVLGVKWGALVWMIDILKGVLAVLIARALLYPHSGWGVWGNVIGGLIVIVGHNWSFFAALLTGRLQGGKGAATWWGAFLMMVPGYVVAGVALTFAGIIALTRYVSLGVLCAIAVGALWVLVLSGQGQMASVYAIYVVLTGLIVTFRHRSNIERLIAGKERRLGEGA